MTVLVSPGCKKTGKLQLLVEVATSVCVQPKSWVGPRMGSVPTVTRSHDDQHVDIHAASRADVGVLEVRMRRGARWGCVVVELPGRAAEIERGRCFNLGRGRAAVCLSLATHRSIASLCLCVSFVSFFWACVTPAVSPRSRTRSRIDHCDPRLR
jgi:hypothetical protein